MNWLQIALLAWIVAAGIVLSVALFRKRSGMPVDRNMPVVATAIAVTLIVVSAQAARIQVANQDAIASRTEVSSINGEVIANPRLATGDIDSPRGSILTADGVPIAWSVETDDGYVRHYADPALSSVAGFFSPLQFGASGLESSESEALSSGVTGSIVEQVEELLGFRNGEPATLNLSIDADVQRLAGDLLGDRTGAAVVVDVHTGEIVAMASSPAIDASRIFAIDKTDRDAASQYWQETLADPRHPMINRAASGLYAPGSIFKVITAAAVIDSGIAEPDTVYVDTGALNVDGHIIVEENRPDDSIDSWTLLQGLAYSLNVVFAQVGLDLGAEAMESYARAFGFELAIPFDIETASSQIANSEEFLDSSVGLADTAFGQGELLVTPLHMALVAAGIANDSVIMQPTLVSSYSDSDGGLIQEVQPEIWNVPVSAETAADVQGMMIESVLNGYAFAAAQPGYLIGGKTGTAETGGGEPHGWFIGFGGVDAPQYAVAVVLEHGGSGGGDPAHIGGDLLAAAIESN